LAIWQVLQLFLYIVSPEGAAVGVFVVPVPGVALLPQEAIDNVMTASSMVQKFFIL
jgi:hypothetical protein